MQINADASVLGEWMRIIAPSIGPLQQEWIGGSPRLGTDGYPDLAHSFDALDRGGATR